MLCGQCANNVLPSRRLNSLLFEAVRRTEEKFWVRQVGRGAWMITGQPCCIPVYLTVYLTGTTKLHLSPILWTQAQPLMSMHAGCSVWHKCTLWTINVYFDRTETSSFSSFHRLSLFCRLVAVLLFRPGTNLWLSTNRNKAASTPNQAQRGAARGRVFYCLYCVLVWICLKCYFSAAFRLIFECFFDFSQPATRRRRRRTVCDKTRAAGDFC